MPFPSRSVQFFMTESDEREFLDFVKSTGDVRFFDHVSRTAEFRPIETLPVPSGPGVRIGFYMLNRSVSTRFLAYPPSRHFLEDKDAYHLNDLDSSVVSFIRCYREPGALFEGGLGVVSYYVGRSYLTLVPKEPEFLKWYDSLARWLRKRYVKLECTSFLRVGPDAGTQFEEGLVELILARNLTQEIVVEGNLSKNKQVTRKRKGPDAFSH